MIHLALPSAGISSKKRCEEQSGLGTVIAMEKQDAVCSIHHDCVEVHDTNDGRADMSRHSFLAPARRPDEATMTAAQTQAMLLCCVATASEAAHCLRRSIGPRAASEFCVTRVAWVGYLHTRFANSRRRDRHVGRKRLNACDSQDKKGKPRTRSAGRHPSILDQSCCLVQ